MSASALKRDETAFQTRMVVNGSVSTSVPRLTPQPSPAPRPAAPSARPHRVPEMVQMIPMTVGAVVTVMMGIAYLQCCARTTREAYRRASLMQEARQERAIAVRMRQIQAQTANPRAVEQLAAGMGMVPANESQSITIR